jgi:hypothetical protein
MSMSMSMSMSMYMFIGSQIIKDFYLFIFEVLFKHWPPLRFHCVGGTKLSSDCCDFDFAL